jgi:hypothetical protein
MKLRRLLLPLAACALLLPASAATASAAVSRGCTIQINRGDLGSVYLEAKGPSLAVAMGGCRAGARFARAQKALRAYHAGARVAGTPAIPGTPSTYIPGSSSPDIYVPGISIPGTYSPGTTIGGVYIPGVSIPGTYLPGYSIPGTGSYSPGFTIPGTPGIPATPGYNLPGTWSAPKVTISQRLFVGKAGDTRRCAKVVDDGYRVTVYGKRSTLWVRQFASGICRASA